MTSIRRLFAAPPPEYSPVPMWWWSGERIEPDRVRWQMEQMVAAGMRNAVVINLAPAGPMYGSEPDDPPYQSERWWEVFLGACRDADELGMRLWFYDHLGFSGANRQADLVRADASRAGAWLESRTAVGEGALTVAAPRGAAVLGAWAVPFDEEGRAAGAPCSVDVDVDAGSARWTATGAWSLRIAWVSRRGFDYTSAPACADLIDGVHGEFERRAAAYLGRVVVGSFQDELPTMPTWSPRFVEEFRARRGYDIVPRLGLLWEPCSPEAESLRADYQAVRAELVEAAFFRPLAEWHERHGLLAGCDQQHPARLGEPIGTVALYADYFRTHRWFSAPGADQQGDTKIHSSISHLHGGRRVWFEAFHSSGWGGTLEETFDWLVPWLRAGATLYDPHGVYYTTRGGWWEWAPPSTCWRQPYWRHYPLFAAAVARLCAVLSQGSHVCDVAVLHPTTTVQASCTPDGPLPAADAADAAYRELVGTLHWNHPSPGVLDRDRRDFDVIDDSAIESARVVGGRLVVADESYAAVVLPATTRLLPSSVERLAAFAAEGGCLVAVGVVAAGLEGHAVQVSAPSDVPAALARIPRLVDAPVPTLRRRIADAHVVAVPAAFPSATVQVPGRDPETREPAAYTFDPGRYRRTTTVAVRGVRGAPELWNPVSGVRHAVTARVIGDGVEVDVPFRLAGPLGLLVWDDTRQDATRARPPEPPFDVEVPGPWTADLVPTLDNRHGDLAHPPSATSPPLQTWVVSHRVEGEHTWSNVRATFGPKGWVSGPAPAADLPLPRDGCRGAGAQWRPAVYSLTRGIDGDRIHRFTHGLSGHVPEEFLDLGAVRAGEGVAFRTTVVTDAGGPIHLAVGAAAAKRVWWNGEEVAKPAPGYLWMAPVEVRHGDNDLLVHLVPDGHPTMRWRLSRKLGSGDSPHDRWLRAYWTLTADPDRFARPEWMTGTDPPSPGRTRRFSTGVPLSGGARGGKLQIGANAPVRLLVDGIEVGRQGGFDAYLGASRVQMYSVGPVGEGVATVEVEAEEGEEPLAVLVDGEFEHGDGGVTAVMSGATWSVDGAPARLRRDQWLDPGWTPMRRRPHPLPGACTEPPAVAVAAFGPDAFGPEQRVEWLSWDVPPGATGMVVPLRGEARLWVDGEELQLRAGGAVDVAGRCRPGARIVARIEPERGRSGGALLSGPITWETTSGSIDLGAWSGQGLAAWSGGIRYTTTFDWPGAPGAPAEVDLGRVRGSAEVRLNGNHLGAAFCSPYALDASGSLRAGANELEVLVLNTLAPYLAASTSTPYALDGQVESGLFGPVLVRSGARGT